MLQRAFGGTNLRSFNLPTVFVVPRPNYPRQRRMWQWQQYGRHFKEQDRPCQGYVPIVVLTVRVETKAGEAVLAVRVGTATFHLIVPSRVHPP
mmetsp:Transcript_7587/g.13773  ORF Transcript_7587/g.13773 Transcript_7587/m.13773 type:complete len:93 (-) Transcript_7587:2810-3088(-)